MGVPFDDAAADAMIRAARAADGVLTGQGAARRGAAETALQEYRGGYAELFRLASVTESDDRGRLARVLDDLATQVEEATSKAAEEDARLERVAAWEAREADRDERSRSGSLVDDAAAGVEGVFDRRPSDPPVQPPTVSASFTATQRTRTSAGSPSGTSSADPGDLRSSVAHALACDAAMEEQLQRVSRAWSSFTASCSWVPVSSSTFLVGAAQLLEENRSDAHWTEHVAAAFEHAGSGTLTNQALDLAVVASLTVQGQDPVALLAHMDPEVAAAWLAANPEVLRSLLATPPAWGTPSSVFEALVASQREAGAEPATYASLLQRLYVTRAAETTGIDLATWDTGAGADAVLGQVTGSYEYYASLYLQDPDFAWAGMAALVGPDFAAGFLDLGSFRDHVEQVTPFVPPQYRQLTEQLAGLSDAEIAFYESTFLTMQKDIFFDASTMHEAYLESGLDGIDELYAAGLLGASAVDPADVPEVEDKALRAWRGIDAGIRTGDQSLVDEGNALLLHREQHDTIQHRYDDMRGHPVTGEAFTRILGLVGDASVPDTRTLGQYEGGETASFDYVPNLPGVQGHIETWYVPSQNIADFEVRWDYIENDTLPAWQELANGDPARARELVGASVPERIADRRLDSRWPELLDDLHDSELTWQ